MAKDLENMFEKVTMFPRSRRGFKRGMERDKCATKMSPLSMSVPHLYALYRPRIIASESVDDASFSSDSQAKPSIIEQSRRLRQ